MKHAVLALALATVVAAPARTQPAASRFGAYQTPVDFPERVTTSLYLPMRDGVKLAVSITRPARNGKPAAGRFPVIWQHTLGIAGAGAEGGPVGDGPNGYAAMPTMANYGYVVVQVGRLYFLNQDAVRNLSRRAPWHVESIRGEDVVRVYRLLPGEAPFPDEQGEGPLVRQQ